jgi:hypothetical protein
MAWISELHQERAKHAVDQCEDAIPTQNHHGAQGGTHASGQAA